MLMNQTGIKQISILEPRIFKRDYLVPVHYTYVTLKSLKTIFCKRVRVPERNKEQNNVVSISTSLLMTSSSEIVRAFSFKLEIC
jgi:hypothetical protein